MSQARTCPERWNRWAFARPRGVFGGGGRASQLFFLAICFCSLFWRMEPAPESIRRSACELSNSTGGTDFTVSPHPVVVPAKTLGLFYHTAAVNLAMQRFDLALRRHDRLCLQPRLRRITELLNGRPHCCKKHAFRQSSQCFQTAFVKQSSSASTQQRNTNHTQGLSLWWLITLDEFTTLVGPGTTPRYTRARKARPWVARTT